jgi:hypothetical protein
MVKRAWGGGGSLMRRRWNALDQYGALGVRIVRPDDGLKAYAIDI